MPNLVTILLTAQNCFAVPEVNKKKNPLIRHQRKCRIITTASNILSFSNKEQCTLLQETNVPNLIDKSINKSRLFTLAKKRTEKYSACVWSQIITVIVSFTRKRSAFKGPSVLSTNILWKLIRERALCLKREIQNTN